MTKLRVLVVAESFLPQINGVTNSVRRVLEHLAAEGHEAELVAPTGPDTYAGFRVRRARGANLPFYPDFRLGLETRRRLRQVMAQYRPDVVHIASPATLGYQASRAAEELGIPTVAIYQTDLVGFAERYDVPGGARAAAGLTRRIHHHVDRTLAPSTASIAQLRALGVPEVHRWGRGVDLVAFHPRHRDEGLRQRIAPDGRLLVGYVGRLAAEKELDLLTHLADDPRYALVLVGGGPEEQRLRGLLGSRATFLGLLHGADLSRAYASLDLFVHTGRYETYCQSAQEALASGVPVVAPNAGGPVDVVADGASGLLYRPGDGAALAAAVDRLASDVELRRAMALTALRAVQERSWFAINEQLVTHYRAVIGARAGLRAA
ncbi:glycosyltransferase [Pimelobacter simplex]|uniref:Glycosyltransferase n=1 Tax=Nocardioides simplex TaxID=2045 RepID=A0A0A1DLB7_NOCSI|nr:glycosyltransferase family 1 protein [Pimelobacter simplex]AIY18206.1 Glycosyltransferase [Pimelobacter simplex]MCG8153525.1 glycosyltransferase [Pimelobacter simplex]GEB15809.1 GDP-mannose-dependent alpha-mannosyltransferase [Pimelobacter simplex]SFN11178.1 phosphatidylinositol alpha 1,6-mannosyltransferase [Pimelobacter simplex]